MSKILNVAAAILMLGLAAMGSADARAFNYNQPYHGRQHQPTQDELNAQHQQDVTADQAVVDRLYDQLLSNSEKILKQHPALVR
jgi:hypothetical protein